MSHLSDAIDDINGKKVKIEVNYHLTNNQVIISFGGKYFNIPKEDERFNKILNCIENDTLDIIPDIIDLEKDLRDSGLDVRDGVIFVGNQAMPEALSKRIMQYRAEKLPYDSLLKFWENLKQNPSFNSRQMLYKFLEHNGHPLTKDGCFIAYRGVTNDFKDYRTGRFDNSIGSVCEIPRSEVDDNPNNTCSYGLHIACYDYANGFGSQLIEVKVNPKHVVAVPTDYNGTKMRVCKYKVMSVCENIRDEVVYTGDDSDLRCVIDN